ncbi:BatD family protein [Sinorhizobium meliloti]
MTRASRLYRLIAALFCWIAAAGPALSADPLARASLQSKGTLYAGQQILIDVDVLVPNYFLQPPQFPAIDLPGAIVTLDDGRALNLNETIDGTAYSGIRRTYIVTPQSPGDFTLPPAVITFGYAAVPPSGHPRRSYASTASLHRSGSAGECRRTSRCGCRKGQHPPGAGSGSGSSEGG